MFSSPDSSGTGYSHRRAKTPSRSTNDRESDSRSARSPLCEAIDVPRCFMEEKVSYVDLSSVKWKLTKSGAKESANQLSCQPPTGPEGGSGSRMACVAGPLSFASSNYSMWRAVREVEYRANLLDKSPPKASLSAVCHSNDNNARLW